MPTASGKTLPVLASAMVLEEARKVKKTILCVCPTKALMNEQVATSRLCGLNAEAYNSDLDEKKKKEVVSSLHEGKLNLCTPFHFPSSYRISSSLSSSIVYFAPEALEAPTFMAALTSEQGLRVIYGIWADEV